MRNDAEIQRAVQLLFEGVAPERSEELRELWSRYQPRFNIWADAGPGGLFILDAGAYRDIRVNHRALRCFWLAVFIAWEGYRAVADGHHELGVDLTRFRMMCMTIEKILTVDDPESVPFPIGVPEPGTLPDAVKEPQSRAAAELALFAVGWALLHEVRHIQHQQEGTGAGYGESPEKVHEEEFSCDAYATSFLLDEVEKYSHGEAVPPGMVLQKREIGIYFALFAMSLIGVGHWDASESHPAMEARIRAVMKRMASTGKRQSDAIAHAAFVALWTLWPDAPGPFKVV